VPAGGVCRPRSGTRGCWGKAVVLRAASSRGRRACSPGTLGTERVRWASEAGATCRLRLPGEGRRVQMPLACRCGGVGGPRPPRRGCSALTSARVWLFTRVLPVSLSGHFEVSSFCPCSPYFPHGPLSRVPEHLNNWAACICDLVQPVFFAITAVTLVGKTGFVLSVSGVQFLCVSG
jgi:hypothetical protein